MSAPYHVVVVGRDAELWLAAAAIRRGLAHSGVSVEAIQLPSKLPRWAVYPTLPPLEALHRKLRIGEVDLLGATGGSFSLGWSFGEGAESFFHAWGAYGRGIDGQDFLPCWLRAGRLGLKLPFQDFSLTAVAARAGRMLVPDEETAQFGRSDYAYHLPAHLYAAFLKKQALSLGVVAHRANEIFVEKSEEEAIRAVRANDDRRFAADLFVDATGADALLLGALADASEAHGQPPVDRILTSHAPKLQRLHPFASFRADTSGWTTLFPTQSGTNILHAYSRESASDEEAIKAASVAAQHGLSELTIACVDGGSDRPHWVGNTIGLGATAAKLDPIHGADLHSAQLGIVHLLNLFPVSQQFAAERAEYNRILGQSVSRIRDFQAAYYRLSPHKGSFWSRARSAAISSELEHRIATFMARGEIAPLEYDTFSPDSWRAILIGLRVLPESWLPSADQVTPEALGAGIRSTIEFIRAKVLQQADHGVHLKRIAGAGA